MGKSLRHFGMVSALIAAIAYSVHMPHVDSDGGGQPSHHCCVCHTIAMTAPAAMPSMKPPVVYASALPWTVPSLLAFDLFPAESPRGPPTV